MPIKNIIVTLVLFLLNVTVFAQDFSALQKLIERRIPALKNKVIFESLKVLNDTAIYYTLRKKLYIKAGTISAASVALNNYLQKYCNSSMSHTGDNVHIPIILPLVNKSVIIASKYPVRYALNYCTYNYTMSFWGWKEWEKELDWMSLNGVNLMLTPMGTEEVWQRTLKQFGFTDAEIKQYIPGPAFNAWWLMGNLEGWGGPVSDVVIHHWTVLQQKILMRMKELGIEPVLQGFWGMVPTILKKKYPNANIIDQGEWAGGFHRPSVLLSQDSLFTRIADVYYRNMKALYGGNIKYFGGDLFHEGGKSIGLDITAVAHLVQANMQKYFPGAIWVLQGWQGNPDAALLKGLDPSKTLILDLMGDRSENWQQRNGYEHFPWVWCTITNFGGKTIMEGKLLRVLTEPERARQSPKGKTLKGIGIIPEGIINNDIIYRWALEGAWQKELPDPTRYLNEYIRSRYGKNDVHLSKAWQYLLQSVYITHSKEFAGGYESILCARPENNIVRSVSTWGPKEMIYDTEILYCAAQEFSKSAKQFETVETYRYDLVDIWRQVIAAKARTVYDALMLDFKQNNKAAFIPKRDAFIKLLLLQDKWTGTHPAFRVGTWLQAAKDMIPDVQDKQLCEWNARTQITYWGSDNPQTDLHEYAHKEWNGILKDLYLPRWQKFFDYALQKMEGKSATFPDFFAMEKLWSEADNPYSAKPESDCIKMLPDLIKILSKF